MLKALLSKLFPDALSEPLSPSHRHQLVVRDEMDRDPIDDPINWLPSKKLRPKISRPFLWKERQGK